MTTIARRALLVLLVPPLLLIAACSTTTHVIGAQRLPPGWQTAAQASADYLAEEKKLPALPAGANWPDPNIKAVDTDGHGILYGTGLGFQYADAAWECAWMKRLLSTATASPTYRDELTSLGAYQHTYIYLNEAELRDPFDAELRAARLGDTSGFATDYSANCH